MEVGDFDAVNGKVFVRFAKGGRPRHVPLSAEGLAFFERQSAGKRRGDRMFTRSDGEPWGRAHQHRRIKDACDAAGIESTTSFHILRHTYGSALAQAGVPLKAIAEALGHADTRITERHYGHLSDEYVAQQVRANLPDFGFEPDNVTPLKPERKAGT
jgi:integrase